MALKSCNYRHTLIIPRDLNPRVLHQNGQKSQMRQRINCKLTNASTYSSRIATYTYLCESPNASLDQYLEDKPRVFTAILPDKCRSQQLNHEEWRVQMFPVQFLFLTCSPVIDMRFRCNSDGYNYPTGVPPQVSKVHVLDIVRWELPGLEDIVKPSMISLSVNGVLYPYRQGNRSCLKVQLSMSITFDLPPGLALIPEDVRRDFAEALLKRLMKDIKEKVNGSLLADYNKFKSEQTRKL